MKNPHLSNLTWISLWWPEIWPHEQLISPIEISVNWPGSYYFLEPGQFTLISMGQWGIHAAISSPPPWTWWIDSHQSWAVDVFHHAPTIHISKTLKCKTKRGFFFVLFFVFFCFFVMSSLLCSIGPRHAITFFLRKWYECLRYEIGISLQIRRIGLTPRVCNGSKMETFFVFI